MQRVRDEDEVWRITGSGKMDGRTSAILRELWQWREKEAQAADRPAFHVLQNHLLLEAAQAFAAGEAPDFRHFSTRRRQAFREAAEKALSLPESAWPVRRRRVGTRPTARWRELPKRCAAAGTPSRINTGSNLPLLRHAARWTPSPPTKAGARRSSRPGSEVCWSCKRQDVLPSLVPYTPSGDRDREHVLSIEVLTLC